MNYLRELGIGDKNYGVSTGQEWNQTTNKGEHEVISPITGRRIASVYMASREDMEIILKKAEVAFPFWAMFPAPKRGEIIRQIGEKLRTYKKSLGQLVTTEMGKSIQEGYGEVQEMIDICDFAVGLSRQLYGSTMHSERPRHRLYEQYHPLGIVGVITAFNFPVAVWSWNAMIGLVCGDVVLWKPSSKTPLAAIAVQHIVAQVLKDNNLPEGIFNLLIGRGGEIGDQLLNERRIPLISITGSTEVGRHAAEIVGRRLGRTILELGGNNAIIVTPEANLKLALQATVYGGLGTAGQRCTSTRRLIIHEKVYDRFTAALVKTYQGLRIGNPLDEDNQMGPLVDRAAVDAYLRALSRLQAAGGRIIHGGKVLSGQGFESGCYVEPVLAEAENHWNVVQEETFAPILYLMRYSGEVEKAIAMHNAVPQGLSSAIFSNNLQEAEEFLSHQGSDCGIANVNVGTLGAEIGGAFGGEKDTGGGRESGSDAWKAYMRRQTNTINWSTDLPLAQGIKFDVP